MFILLTIAIFILKFLAVGVIGLFFLEDLELVSNVSGTMYSVYITLACITFFSLFFFVLGKKFLWLAVCIICGFGYMVMYNSAPEIAAIHKKNDLKSRYFKDTNTFFARMTDVAHTISKKTK